MLIKKGLFIKIIKLLMFRLEWPKISDDLKSFNHKIFYFSKEDWDDGIKLWQQQC